MLIAELERVVAAFSAYAFGPHDERTLHDGIKVVLAQSGIDYEHERTISPTSRLDFWLPASGLAVEVKVQGDYGPVLRQLTRYCSHPTVTGLLLVTTAAKLTRVPNDLCGKPVRAVRLRGAFG